MRAPEKHPGTFRRQRVGSTLKCENVHSEKTVRGGLYRPRVNKHSHRPTEEGRTRKKMRDGLEIRVLIPNSCSPRETEHDGLLAFMDSV